MVRLKFKWKCALILCSALVIVTNSLPLKNVPATSTGTDLLTDFLVNELERTFKISETTEASLDLGSISPSTIPEDNEAVTIETVKDGNKTRIWPRDGLRELRPGQEVTGYAVEITKDGENFQGRAVLTVEVDMATRDDPLMFHCEGLTIESVAVGIFSDINAAPNPYNLNNGVLEINPNLRGSIYVVIIRYRGPLRNDGKGLFISNFNEVKYLAMNLHPINARRVFPCIDEPNILSTVTFTFNDTDFNHMVANSLLEENSSTQFRPLQGPMHLWGMVAHNLNNINIPIANVLLYARPGVANQDAQAAVAINFYFTQLNEWTRKPYTEIVRDQDGRMHIFAFPDIYRDWYALSTVCLWEPYVLMEGSHSVRQRTTALSTIAEAMARQWFGYVVYPENWRHQWVITGLAKYAGIEMMRLFQHDPQGNDVSLINVDVIFTTEIFQESLLRDSYMTAEPMKPEEDVFDENDIRGVLNGIIKYKAPAILRMLRLVLGDKDDDFIRAGARALLNIRGQQFVNTLNFYDAINSEWLFSNNNLIDDIGEFLEPYIENTGYPLIHVGLRQGGLLLTQEHFSLAGAPQGNYMVPITFTTSANPDFDNLHPTRMLDVTTALNLALGEDDWVLFNIQGQGYYRVNYDGDLWERILNALNDPERRKAIHPLNRATLIDDALNLARASKLDYDIALQIVMSMEHETEYAVWKAFVRNMNFLRKHLIAMINDDEDLDQDIYVRIIRRIMETFEEEIGFDPDPQINEAAMVSLTRGLVMDHACRAEYDPCIAAAVDWFYDPNNNSVVNPNIPNDLRPAVYCTMVREGGQDILEMLDARLEIEPTHYERVVILESFACSEDNAFIRALLLSTIANNSPFSMEERFRIFTAVAESSEDNANAAIAFLSGHTREARNMYGGPEKLEDMILVLADNIVTRDQFDQFMIWVNSVNSFLDDSIDVAERARDQTAVDLEWRSNHLEDVYEWIDENDASTMIVSSLLIFISLCVALFNN
ncbi:membrane alanyl aminopeptidase-like [Epargyreus clarus]|uniref:membrane alanyl aminopeptidase-like n=1 Tax=Epargyreus clarus TaxID=520877 RepID=UPI003C2DD5AB